MRGRSLATVLESGVGHGPGYRRRVDEPPPIRTVVRVASRALPLRPAGTRPLERLGDLAWEHRWALASIAVALIAFAVRARFVLPAGFPLNDGGLFVVMSQDIQAANYLLPATTSYNPAGGVEIPFAYPPLAFYLAALVEDLTPLTMVQVYWVLPLIGSMLAVAGVYVLARTFFSGRMIPLVAAAAFALAPRSFTWLVMGGGLTRSWGLAAALFALAAYRTALSEESSPRTRHRALAAATVFSAITLGTHLEAGVFLAAAVLLTSVSWPDRWRVTAFFTMGVGTLVLTAPWWATVLARHGTEPFMAAMNYGGDVLAEGSVGEGLVERLIAPVMTNEPFFAVIGATGAFGAIIALVRGKWVLPALWGTLIVLNMRALPTFAMVPTALLAAYATIDVILPLFRSAVEQERTELGKWRPALVAGAIAAIAFYGATDATRGEANFLRPVSDDDQRAMRWASWNVPEGSTFLVVPVRGWYADREGEWLPTLTGHPAANVAQGYEWVDGEFNRRLALQYRAYVCGFYTTDCLEELAADVRFTHVYLPANCCATLLESVLEDNRYVVKYRSGAVIAERQEMTGYPPARPISGR